MKLCVLCAQEYQAQDPAAYFRDWDAPVHWIAKATAFQQISALAQAGFEVFVNLCDGCAGEEEAGIEVVHALERLQLAFTGARSDFYDPSRATLKRACQQAGVPTPAFVFVTREDQIAQVVRQLHFPMIVKHPNGHSSIGLYKESLVGDIVQLRAQIQRMLTEYGGALVEEFIAGREFDVLVVENADDPTEPFVYPPVEFLFPPNESFKHYDLKWVNYETMQCVPCTDRALVARLQAMAKKIFVALNGSGYGRCDVRMNARGELYLLEINPNCGVFYPPDEWGSADFILAQHPAGHRGFIERIVRAALHHSPRRCAL